MASIVQSAGAATHASTVTATFGATPTVGNVLVAVGNSDATLTIGGSWTLRQSNVASQGFYVWDRVAGVSEPTAVTITPSVADDAALSIFELSGVSGIDLAGTVTSTGTAAATATASTVTTTGTVGDFVFAVYALHNLGTLPTGPSFDNSFTTAISTIPAGSGGSVCAQYIASRVTSSAGAVGATTASWTNTAHDIDAVLIAYTASSSGTGTATFDFAVGTATAAGIPGDLTGSGTGGEFLLKTAGPAACTTYAAQGGSWT